MSNRFELTGVQRSMVTDNNALNNTANKKGTSMKSLSFSSWILHNLFL